MGRTPRGYPIRALSSFFFPVWACRVKQSEEAHFLLWASRHSWTCLSVGRVFSVMLLMGDEQSSPCFRHCHDSIPRRELTWGWVAVPVWQPFVTDFWFEFFCCCCSVAESCQLFVTPQTVAHQSSLSFTSSWSLLKLMSIELVMPSNYLILCCSLLLLPLFFPSIRIFSSESALHTWWPMYWCFSFSISPSSECSGLISFRIDRFEFFLFRESGTREASVTCWLRVSALGTERIGVQFSFCHWLGV